MLSKITLILLFVAFGNLFVGRAQDAPVITAENVSRLQAVITLPFAALPQAAGQIASGWFAINADGSRITLVNRQQEIVIWDIMHDEFLGAYAVLGYDDLPGTFIMGSLSQNGRYVVSLHTDGLSYWLARHEVDTGHTLISAFGREPDIPLRIWADSATEDIWVEVAASNPVDGQYILRFSAELEEAAILPLEAANDPEARIRIGRVLPPFAITVTEDGAVKRWNLESGRLTAVAQAVDIPAYGQINANGTHLAWRDARSDALYLLDFSDNEDHVVSTLDGTLLPFILLSNAADVILGVNVNFEPTVVAWDVESGEQFELGAYGPCERQPDMVRLSTMGNTLVIGCDLGIEVWRVIP